MRRADRRAGARPHQHADPAAPDPAHAAGDAAHARPLHLRHQRPPVLVGRLVRRRLSRERLLVGILRRDHLQHHFVAPVDAACRASRVERGPRRSRSAHDDDSAAPLQPRILSAAHAGGHRAAARDTPPAEAVEARVLLGHVRRRRLDARRHARDGARVPLRRHGGGAAHFLHGRRARVDRRGAGRSTRRTTSAISSRCAATCRPDEGAAGDFRFASELVAFIRQETGDWFHIDVAAYPECHPQARSLQEDLAAFKRKIDAGADSAITQYFYNPDAYWHFVDACRAAGITVPIVPGIMPIAQLHEARALFGRLRRRNSALDPHEAPRLRRRRRVDPRVRPRRGDGPRRTRCSRAARRDCTSTR